MRLFAILQKYEFSSKSQPYNKWTGEPMCCLRYCKSTSFQANHNTSNMLLLYYKLFAILQKYEFSSKSQLVWLRLDIGLVVCDTAKVRVFKQITTQLFNDLLAGGLFAILQKYEFSSKSQPKFVYRAICTRCLRYCKSTSFQANHNNGGHKFFYSTLFAILQKYEFSSKSQQKNSLPLTCNCCLRYCKSTSFQANHNHLSKRNLDLYVVCDTAKVRVFKQITTNQESG